ncbi:Uncharacterised protein [Bordetella pertussis]|nr:Uncharacterised protein [Bordetella pertussis]
MPRAPSASWRKATSGHLCALAWGRSATPRRSAQSCMTRRLRSNAARSSARLGVSTSHRACPARAAGGSIGATEAFTASFLVRIRFDGCAAHGKS